VVEEEQVQCRKVEEGCSDGAQRGALGRREEQDGAGQVLGQPPLYLRGDCTFTLVSPLTGSTPSCWTCTADQFAGVHTEEQCLSTAPTCMSWLFRKLSKGRTSDVAEMRPSAVQPRVLPLPLPLPLPLFLPLPLPLPLHGEGCAPAVACTPAPVYAGPREAHQEKIRLGEREERSERGEEGQRKGSRAEGGVSNLSP